MDRWSGYPSLPSSWLDLRGDDDEVERRRRAVERELAAELSPDHQLFGHRAAVVGQSESTDDILLLLEGRIWALVHLTWRGSPERPPWPRVKTYDSVHAVQEALDHN
ncbi:hypothetical protein VMT65_31650 [Nocardia sp. CDC153]|uniref:hypothetical protein n=1 Tax=Nocardia sp. CDC153 TaxID=3112167 RepID=UPI002DBBD9FA|nr:hypothetical protein [Nocardia sp. CDC153]MEC3957626.1 hypothetical protein [Nocardia sp. CDC153]